METKVKTLADLTVNQDYYCNPTDNNYTSEHESFDDYLLKVQNLPNY
jgi:hypothetical protein